MLKFRVSLGKPPLKSDSALKSLFDQNGLLIEGSNEVQSFSSADGKSAFLAGKVIGIRESEKEISPATSDKVKNVIFSNSLDKAAEKLEGDFILAVASKNGDCEITLDKYGQPDLFYMTLDKAFAMATDLSLIPVEKSPSYDQNALAHILAVYGYRAPKKHTIFTGVSRLGVKEAARISRNGVKIEDLGFTPLPTQEYGKEKLEDYADIFLDSLKLRGSDEGNVVYLSSGWDSSSILAGLVHVFGKKKVRAVTGRMVYSERSKTINQFELDRAKEIAEYFGVPLEIAEFDYWQKGPEYLDAARDTFNSNNLSSITAVNHMRLAETAKKTAKSPNESIFVGEISDGAHNLGFSQFVTIFHKTLGMREYSDKMNSYFFGPTFLDQLETGGWKTDEIYDLLRGRAGGAVWDDIAKDSTGIKKQLFDTFFLRGVRIPLYSRRNAKLLTEKGQDEHANAMSAYFEKIVPNVDKKNLYSWILQLYNSFHWQGSTVQCVRLAGEAHGLNTHLPFRDSRMIEFLSSMPEDWGRGLEIRPTKYPLKWALENKIDYPLHLQVGPHSYLYDVDPNFSHSAELLYGSAFTPYLKNVLSKKSYEDVLDKGHFNMDYINSVVKNYLDGKEVTGAERNDLFSICMLEWTGDIKRKDLVESN